MHIQAVQFSGRKLRPATTFLMNCSPPASTSSQGNGSGRGGCIPHGVICLGTLTYGVVATTQVENPLPHLAVAAIVSIIGNGLCARFLRPRPKSRYGGKIKTISTAPPKKW